MARGKALVASALLVTTAFLSGCGDESSDSELEDSGFNHEKYTNCENVQNGYDLGIDMRADAIEYCISIGEFSY